jgi:hypothetical protein
MLLVPSFLILFCVITVTVLGEHGVTTVINNFTAMRSSDFRHLVKSANYKTEGDCLLGCYALMTEEVCTSETSVSFYQTTRRNIPEDRNLLIVVPCISLHSHTIKKIRKHLYLSLKELTDTKYIFA